MKKNNLENELQDQEADSCCSNSTCCAPASPIVRSMPKVGRNDPCPCDSGKKHKKCCG